MKIVFKTIVLATAVLLLVVIATIDSATITLTGMFIFDYIYIIVYIILEKSLIKLLLTKKN